MLRQIIFKLLLLLFLCTSILLGTALGPILIIKIINHYQKNITIHYGYGNLLHKLYIRNATINISSQKKININDIEINDFLKNLFTGSIKFSIQNIKAHMPSTEWYLLKLKSHNQTINLINIQGLVSLQKYTTQLNIENFIIDQNDHQNNFKQIKVVIDYQNKLHNKISINNTSKENLLLAKLIWQSANNNLKIDTIDLHSNLGNINISHSFIKLQNNIWHWHINSKIFNLKLNYFVNQEGILNTQIQNYGYWQSINDYNFTFQSNSNNSYIWQQPLNFDIKIKKSSQNLFIENLKLNFLQNNIVLSGNFSIDKQTKLILNSKLQFPLENKEKKVITTINAQLTGKKKNLQLQSNIQANMDNYEVHLSSKVNDILAPTKTINITQAFIKNNHTLWFLRKQKLKNNIQYIDKYQKLIIPSICFITKLTNESICIQGVYNPQTKLMAKINTHINLQNSLPQLVSDFIIRKGTLNGNIDLTGDLNNLQWQPKFNVNNLAIFFPQYGINLHNINLQIHQDIHHKLILQGYGKTLAGDIFNLQGNILQTNPFSANILLTAPKIKLSAYNPIGTAILTPHLNINIVKHNADIKGSIMISKASLKIVHDLIRDKPLPEIKIINNNIHKYLTDENKNHLTVNIDLIAKKPIFIQAKNFKASLIGKINLFTTQNNRELVNGEIQLLKGSYIFKNKEIAINKGTLIYNRNPLQNPKINIVMQKTTGFNFNEEENIIIGIEAKGTLQEPTVKIFSIPELNDADKLSYLLFDVSAGNISLAQNQIALELANEVFNLGLSSKGLLQTLSNKLHFDNISIQYTNLYNGKDLESSYQPTLVIEKRIWQKILLRYLVGLNDPVNEVQGQYKLSRHFTMQGDIRNTNILGLNLIFSAETD